MNEILKKIDLIINDISDEYPYKVVGIASTYSQYNEAWTDACDRIKSEITGILSKQKDPLTIGDKIRESNESLAEAIKGVPCDICISNGGSDGCTGNCKDMILAYLNQKAD